MRGLIWLVAILTALYGGYWVVGSRAALSGAETALNQMKARGLADYGEVSIAGFPSRFDLTVENPSFRSADGRLGWGADFLQVLALSYRPNHIIAALPDRQDLATPAGPATLTGTGFRASAAFAASTTLPLDHAQLVGTTPDLTGAAGWGATASELRAAIRKAQDGTVNAYDLALEIPGAAPRGSLADWLSPLADPAADAGRVAVKAMVTLDRPIDRISGPRRILAINLDEAVLFWGRADVSARGAVTLSADGIPEGRVEVTARNWSDLLDFAVARGLVDARTAPTVRKVLGQLALASGDAAALKLPLVFAEGRMSLGPVPLGPAPRF